MFSMTQVVRNSLSFLFVLSRTFLSCLRLTFNFKSRLLLFLFCHHIWMFWKKLGKKSAFESWCCSNRSKGRTQTRWKLHAGPCMHTADSRMRITNRGMLRLGECWDWDTCLKLDMIFSVLQFVRLTVLEFVRFRGFRVNARPNRRNWWTVPNYSGPVQT